MEGVVAATLLIGGGLTALQTAPVITGLPFAIILLIMIYSLNEGLKQEYEVEEIVRKKVREVREDLIINEIINTVVHDHALINKDSTENAEKNNKVDKEVVNEIKKKEKSAEKEDKNN